MSSGTSEVSNLTLMLVIAIEPRLHPPMYYFLAMLSFVDILLCTVATPKVLSVLCYGSSIFLVMAYDRYVLSCHPLHYPTVITNQLVARASGFVLIRNFVLLLPFPSWPQGWIIVPVETSLNVTVKTVGGNLSCSAFTASSIYGLVVFFVGVVVSRSFSAAFKAFKHAAPSDTDLLFFYHGHHNLSNRAIKQIPRQVHVLRSIMHYLLPRIEPSCVWSHDKGDQTSNKELLSKMKFHPQISP
ncbi:hypothetical protein GDO86_004788 [Hymenochirus boettgeri]|uniref:G-protein coupled receptors family 1 profile domain-containing protein n=1 Tax=Hymenochirus boettgeri TaxID=247094 RepID=A0A8T2K6G8_9PIPI|nr:hypothetical protein GDO86_004788 [Hymenochirus boettgeri]